MQPVGQARTEVEIVDVSVLVNTGLKGIVGVLGITERGEPNKPLLIGSWIEYQRAFGGLMTGSDFPLICKRALEAGGRLKISRVAHYTNLADKTTIDGVKALKVITQAAVTGVGATNKFDITSAGATGDTIIISVDTGLGTIVLGTYTKLVADTAALIVSGLVADINANTLTTGYTANNSGGPTQLTVVAPVADGATANSYIALDTIVGTIAGTWSTATFTGGVTAVAAFTITGKAKSIGAWGNALSFQFKAPANGQANTLDLYVDLVGYPDLQEVFKNVNVALTATEIAQINGKSKLIDFSAFTGTLGVLATSTLATGAQTLGSILPIDYVGNAAGETGIHSFDNDFEIVKIAVPELANPVVDIALAAYADMRKDIRAILRTPVGLDGQGIIDYREGTGIYSHSPVNTWRASMFTGGLKVTHPATGLEKELTEVGDVIGAYSRKDNKSLEWFTVAGPKRGVIKNALGVVYNLGSSARQAQADAVDVHGVNAIIQHETFGVVIWGNSTLQKADTLLKHDNVADLLIFLTRALKPLIQSETFDPNDIETWKAIHRRVVPLMDFVKENRGVWNYLYQGDQDIDNVNQAVVNTSANINAGQYIFNLFISPKVGMKYQGVKVVVANSGVNFEELTNI